MSPFEKKNGPDRCLSQNDEAVLVQTLLDKPGVCLRELKETLILRRGVDVDESTIW